MKRIWIVAATALLIIMGCAVYYTFPLRSHRVVHDLDRVENIHVVYENGAKISRYILTKEKGADFKKLTAILQTTTYNREIRKFKGGTGGALMLDIFYRDRDGKLVDQFVDIRELGIIIRDDHEFKINGDAQILFQRILAWIQQEGSFIPKGAVI